MDAQLSSLLTKAFSNYLAKRESHQLEPQLAPLSYDFLNWPAKSLGEDMVKDQLRELTNILNGWKNALRRWHAWNMALEGFPEIRDAWDVQIEFLQPLVHQCLLEPSAIRDQITYVATNSIHQVLLATVQGYPDHLPGDPTSVKSKPRFLTRLEKEKRLAGLVSKLPSCHDFIQALQAIDDDAYIQATLDYRNRSNHALAPRLAIGIVESVTRHIVPKTVMVKNERGSFSLIEDGDKVSVSYGVGGMSPLDLDDARAANLGQFLQARRCYELYRQMLASAGVGPGKAFLRGLGSV